MLGVTGDTVWLAPHDPAWKERFGEVAGQIAGATGLPLGRIQHVGSTAVPELAAKPILDIDVGIVGSEDIEVVADGLVRLGFIDRGAGDAGTGRLLVREPTPGVRTIHVHVLLHDSVWWRCDLAFRDALRADPELRRNYGRLKAKLAERFPSDREAYRDGKALFIGNSLYRVDPTGWAERTRP